MFPDKPMADYLIAAIIASAALACLIYGAADVFIRARTKHLADAVRESRRTL